MDAISTQMLRITQQRLRRQYPIRLAADRGWHPVYLYIRSVFAIIVTIFFTVAILFTAGQAPAPVGLLQFAAQTQTLSAVVCIVTTGNCTGTGGGSSLFTAATCDGQNVTTNVTIANGSPNLAVSSAIFAAGDVGKTINIAGAGASGVPLLSTINTFTDSSHVVLANNAGTALTAQSEVVQWGHSDSAAFNSFNSWAAGTWQASHSGRVELDIPHGDICLLISGGTSFFASGIKDFLLVGLGYSGSGDGATITDFNNISNSGGFYLGAGGTGANTTGGICYAGIWENSGAGFTGCSSRTEAITAGDTCVNLIIADASTDLSGSPSGITLAILASRFVAPNWIIIAGFDMQGFGGPFNDYFFEYHQISSVSSTLKCDGVTSGASVKFVGGATFSYKTTLPVYFKGNALNGEPDQGGPATIWALSVNWGASAEYRGLHISNDGQQSNNIQSITYDHTLADGRFESFAGGFECQYPSQVQTWVLKNSDWSSCSLEVDKLVGSMTISNSTLNKPVFQSASVRTVTVNLGSVINDMDGTGDSTVCDHATLGSLDLAPTGYGVSTRFDGNVCTINAITQAGYLYDNVNSFYTMSGGVITIAKGRTVTARAAGNANGVGGCTGSSGNCVRLTLSCSTCAQAPTALFSSGMKTWIQPSSGNCSADVPQNTYTFDVIDGTHIDLRATTYGSGSTVAAGCGTLQAPVNGLAWPPSWAIPGANIVFTGSRYSGPVCQVSDLTTDGDAVYAALSGTGSNCNAGFPTVPVTSGNLMLQPHLMSVFNCTGCLGAGAAIFAVLPNGHPYGEWAQTILNSGNTTKGLFGVNGTLSSLTFDITSTAGGETIDLQATSFWINAAGTTVTSYNPPAESLSSVHTCTITPTTNVGCGQATAPGSALWALPDQVIPELNGGTAGSVTVTIQTNQHVVAGP